MEEPVAVGRAISTPENTPPDSHPTGYEDWMDYDTPEVLTRLLLPSPETVVVVVQSSVENVRREVAAEKERAQQPGEALGEPVETESGKGKRKADDEPIEGRLTTPAAPSWPLSSLPPPVEPRKTRGRSRFGISRLLRHVVDKGDRNHADRSQASDTPSPTAFTQIVYKHIKAATAPSEPEGPVECVSCLDDISPKDGIKTVCHYYCRECFAQLIQTAIDNEAQWPPKCCLNPVPFRTITKHISGDLLSAYREKEEEFRVPLESRIYCSVPDCGAWIRERHTKRSTKTGRCPRGHVICIVCRERAHAAGEACPQDRDRQMADRLAEEEGWRRCYKCSVLVEHSDACQHMTCRCGAEFCYVCGARWCTCACTMAQLHQIKDRARQRRQARTAEEQAEARELSEILRQIEQFEANEAVEAVAARIEMERERAKRRRRAAEERAEREGVRLAEVARRYEGLRSSLTSLNEAQLAALQEGHGAERDRAVEQAEAARATMDDQHEAERGDLRAKTAKKIAERKLEWERDLRHRVCLEDVLEAEYLARLMERGYKRAEAAKRAYMKKNDRRFDAWKKWQETDLEHFVHAQRDDLAIREELMDNARLRLDERLAAEAEDLGRKHGAEETWFERVAAERFRLMFELETMERETGAEPDPEGWSSEDEAIPMENIPPNTTADMNWI